MAPRGPKAFVVLRKILQVPKDADILKLNMFV